jgi:site-specific DNA recombinase
MLDNIVKYFRNADGVTKNKILSCIFIGKLVLENGRVAATPFSVPVQIILNITKGFERSGKKKEVKFDLFLEFAPLTAQSCNRIISLQFSECLNF